MAAKASKKTGDESAIVKITDKDGRAHYTARGSAFHRSAGDDAKIEGVPDASDDADDTAGDSDASVPA